MQLLECEECGNNVMVEKFSAYQVSVQWSGRAHQMCPRIASDRSSARPGVGSCPALRLSIDSRVRSGKLEVTRRHEEPTHGAY